MFQGQAPSSQDTKDIWQEFVQGGKMTREEWVTFSQMLLLVAIASSEQ